MCFMIFGAGLSARAFARQSLSKIYGTTRCIARFELLRQNNILPLLYPKTLEQDNNIQNLDNILGDITHLIISIAPDENGDILLRQPEVFDKMHNLKWICYLSTVGVYGDYQGAWIDETANCHPHSKRNQARLLAEDTWQNYAKTRNLPLAILRLAGIYGCGRNAFIKLQNHKAHRIIKEGQVFNRIHTEDIAGVIELFAKNLQSGLFNLADNAPSPPQDVISYAANIMHITPPEEIPFEKAELSPMARSFYKDNKRISNKKLLNLGYTLKYPNYKIALDTMWKNQNWQKG